jgi:hypothetical protein
MLTNQAGWEQLTNAMTTVREQVSQWRAISMSDDISSLEIPYPNSYRAFSMVSEADCMLTYDGTGKVYLLDEHLSAITVHCRIMEC